MTPAWTRAIWSRAEPISRSPRAASPRDQRRGGGGDADPQYGELVEIVAPVPHLFLTERDVIDDQFQAAPREGQDDSSEGRSDLLAVWPGDDAIGFLPCLVARFLEAIAIALRSPVQSLTLGGISSIKVSMLI